MDEGSDVTRPTEAFEAKPLDAGFEGRVRDSFARQPLMNLLGIEMLRVEPGLCELAVVRRPKLTQQHGFIHGAVIGAMCDDAAAYAAYTLFPRHSTVLAVEYKVNFVAPARGRRLRAVGFVVRSGRTLTTSRVDVFSGEESGERLCATSLHTLMRLDHTPDRPHSGPVAGD